MESGLYTFEVNHINFRYTAVDLQNSHAARIHSRLGRIIYLEVVVSLIPKPINDINCCDHIDAISIYILHSAFIADIIYHYRKLGMVQ